MHLILTLIYTNYSERDTAALELLYTNLINIKYKYTINE